MGRYPPPWGADFSPWPLFSTPRCGRSSSVNLNGPVPTRWRRWSSTRADANASRPSKPRRLRAIRYDAHRDVVELSAGGDGDLAPAVRYFIRSPRRITVEEMPDGSRILIEDGAQGVTEIAIDESDERRGSRVATELGRRFSRDLPASPAPAGRSLVGRLAMRRHAGAGAD